MSSVHRCPVCYGKGIVPNGFYSSTSNTWSSSSTNPETCRSCGGRGVIEVHDQVFAPITIGTTETDKLKEQARRNPGSITGRVR